MVGLSRHEETMHVVSGQIPVFRCSAGFSVAWISRQAVVLTRRSMWWNSIARPRDQTSPESRSRSANSRGIHRGGLAEVSSCQRSLASCNVPRFVENFGL